MARCQVPFSFFYPATVSAQQVDEPVIGTAITIINRDNGNPATLFSSETGVGTITTLITNAAGTVPSCWVVEGSYLITAAPLGSFTGVSVAWEAVRGDGVANVAPGAIGTTQIQAGAVTAATMGSGAASTNVGALGGVLAGTLPNPSLAGGVTATPSGAAGGGLSGTYPNPAIAAGAAATNVGTLGGVLSGSLPNPSLAVGLHVTPGGTAGGALAGTYPNPTLASGAAASNVGAIGGDLTGTLPNPTLNPTVSAALVYRYQSHIIASDNPCVVSVPISAPSVVLIVARAVIEKTAGGNGHIECRLEFDGTDIQSTNSLVGITSLASANSDLRNPSANYLFASGDPSIGMIFVGGQSTAPEFSILGGLPQLIGAPVAFWVSTAATHTFGLIAVASGGDTITAREKFIEVMVMT